MQETARPKSSKHMWHANRNFIIAYIFLVGLPLLGLVGVLKTGRNLTAPASVDGTWKVEAATDPQAASASSCGNYYSAITSQPLSISQSGPNLVIALAGGTRTTAGTIEGKTLTAQFRGGDGSRGACADRSLNLTAALDSQAEPRTLLGTIRVENCAACLLQFHAVRQPRAAAGGTH